MSLGTKLMMINANHQTSRRAALFATNNICSKLLHTTTTTTTTTSNNNNNKNNKETHTRQQNQHEENNKKEEKSSSSSSSEEPSASPSLPTRELILSHAMKRVPELGFTSQALSQGAVDAGLSSAAQGIFANGEFDLVDYFYKRSNQQLATYLEDLVQLGEIKSKNELIRRAVVYRLGLIQPYVDQWPHAMAVMSFSGPRHALVSIENLLRLCDEIWYQVGDDSNDFNWYTKRLTLAAVYKSTELFMIQDKSEHFAATNEFLNSRFKDLAYFYKAKKQVSDFTSSVVGSLTVAANVLRDTKK